MTTPVFEHIHQVILEKLARANSSVQILMAWFTDQEIMDLLIQKASSGVHVELILLDHEGSRKKEWEVSNIGITQFERFKLDLNQLRKQNVEIILIDPKAEFFLHSKFCIIDSSLVITGSYNWTYPAKRNIENIVVMEDLGIAEKYQAEFERIRSEKHRLLMDLAALPKCSHCGRSVARIRIYDYFNNTSRYHDDVKDVLFCLEEPIDHLYIEYDGEDWQLQLGELIRYEHEQLENASETGEDKKIDARQWDLIISNAVAEYFGSTNDLFLDNVADKIFVVMKRVPDPSSEGEDSTFQIIWSNDLFNAHAQKFLEWGMELEEKMYPF